jgi:hypothetical protein
LKCRPISAALRAPHLAEQDVRQPAVPMIGRCQVALTNQVIELIQRHSRSTAIMDSEAIHRPWRNARFETITGRLFTVLPDSDMMAFIDQRAARK